MLIHTKRTLLVAALACSACSDPGVNDKGGIGPGDGKGGRNAGSGGSESGGAFIGFGGNGTGATGDGTDGGTGSPPPNQCAANGAEAKPVPLDIALLVDTSYSMDFDLRWQYVKGALLSFVSGRGQDDLGLSLQFFPLRAQCDVDSYATPALPMARVGSARGDIQSTLDARHMNGGTPIVQALQGVGDYATTWAKAHPGDKTVIVVATDGVPDATCAAASLMPPNDIDNAAKTAQAFATGTPALPVFVIGVGAELDALDAIAKAGGTDHAVLISDGANAQAELLQALQNIRRLSLGCDYVIPESTGGKIDYGRVNVDFTNGNRAAEAFYYAEDAAGCDTDPDRSWYYDDPDAPTKVVLCPKTCERVSRSEAARLDIAFGCVQRIAR